MKLILHIGTVKTGTTTAQAWLAGNRKSLVERGVWYPTAFPATDARPGGHNHPFAIDIVLSPDHFRENALAAFRGEYDQMRRAGCTVCIISFEDLYFRLASAQMVGDLAEFLRAYFESVEVVLYLRPQIDTAVSFASTASKLGVRIDRSWFHGQKHNRAVFDYNAAIERWESGFGGENLRCFAYKRDLPFLDYVIEHLSLDRQSFGPVENQNLSVGVNIIALSNVLQIPLFFSETLLQHLPRSAPLSVGIDVARAFQAKFTESNAELARRHETIRLEDLEPDWSRYELPSNLDEIERECIFADELKALMRVFSRQLCLERARNALIRAELAKAQGKGRAAIAMANRALTEANRASQVEVFRWEAEKIQEAATALIALQTGEASLG
ncbi:hypothetical protein [Parvibaculum sp.]|uniref:hypothetical protein n=1 Tax=Parvibaculum sp. TaxID=2024848 RepID=UPI00320ED8CF